MGKVIGISMIRNESDIIEVFCRYNLNLIDELYLIDNDSSDNTVEIIEHLISEGLPIYLSHSEERTHSQERFLTEKMQELSQRHTDISYIIPLDADELIMNNSKEDFIADISRIELLTNGKGCGVMFWESHLPEGIVTNSIFYEQMSLVRNTSSLALEMRKLVIPASLDLDNYIISPGSHVLFDESKKPVHSMLLRTRLGHFPVRTCEQIIRKVIMGELALKMKGVNELEGWHWKSLSNLIRQQGFSLTTEQLRSVACFYALNLKQSMDIQIHKKSVNHFANVVVKYQQRPLNVTNDLYILAVSLIENNQR